MKMNFSTSKLHPGMKMPLELKNFVDVLKEFTIENDDVSKDCQKNRCLSPSNIGREDQGNRKKSTGKYFVRVTRNFNTISFCLIVFKQ